MKNMNIKISCCDHSKAFNIQMNYCNENLEKTIKECTGDVIVSIACIMNVYLFSDILNYKLDYDDDVDYYVIHPICMCGLLFSLTVFYLLFFKYSFNNFIKNVKHS
jgi:hypothetical protein